MLFRAQQVAVLGGHRQSAGTANPNYVGAQIREHHRGVWARSDATKFDDSHAGQRPGQARPFFTSSTRSRKPWVPASIVPLMARFRTKPGTGTTGSTLIWNVTLVRSPSGVNV